MKKLKLNHVVENLSTLKTELDEYTNGELFVLAGRDNIDELKITVERAIELLNGMMNRNKM